MSLAGWMGRGYSVAVAWPLIRACVDSSFELAVARAEDCSCPPPAAPTPSTQPVMDWEGGLAMSSVARWLVLANRTSFEIDFHCWLRGWLDWCRFCCCWELQLLAVCFGCSPPVCESFEFDRDRSIAFSKEAPFSPSSRGWWCRCGAAGWLISFLCPWLA